MTADFSIVLEATPILPKPSGVGLYVLNLLEHLYELQAQENFNLGISYQPSFKNWLLRNFSVPESLTRYPDIEVLPIPVRLLNALARIPHNPFLRNLERRFGKPDIYHGTNYSVYPCRYSLRIMNIYDLSFIRYSDYATAVVKTFASRVRWCLRWTDLVITISESSKRDIVEFLNVPPDRVWVTPLASRYSAFEVPSQAVYKELETTVNYDFSKPYILFVSTLEPRKNVVALIQAFNYLKSKVDVDHNLVLIGRKGWQYGPIFEAIAQSPWHQQIYHLDYLSDSLVAHFYRRADVFAYPSFYEGFGLPALEAMTLGCPVVTANTSSLPEVVGDAALMVDPADPVELADRLQQVICDRALHADLVQRGKARAATFSWERTARATLDAYRSLL